jgi:6-phosphogluconolactonase
MMDTALAGNRIFDNAEALATNVAIWLCGLAQASDRAFAVSLSGGSTPHRLYECLAEPPVVARFPWGRVHWFWGDERFVPHDHSDSNFGMARNAFLSRVPVPTDNVHAIPTQGLSPEQAAAAYEATLKRFYGADTLASGRPLFDVTLLGIGAKSEPRITLTYPALDSSRDVAFVVTGRGKRDVVARAKAGDCAIPAGLVRPVGRLHWFTDRAAAAEGAK